MVNKTIVKISCDFCEDMIAEYPFPITEEKVNEEVEDWGGLVSGKKHFCNAGCYADFCNDAEEKKDYGDSQ